MTQDELSSNNFAGSFLITIPLATCMCWLIDLSHTHSWDDLWSAIVYAWFEEVATRVCFWERQEIAVPPIVETWLVCDQALWGSDKYIASAKPTILNLSFLNKINSKSICTLKVTKYMFYSVLMSVGRIRTISCKKVSSKRNIGSSKFCKI